VEVDVHPGADVACSGGRLLRRVIFSTISEFRIGAPPFSMACANFGHIIGDFEKQAPHAGHSAHLSAVGS